MHLEIRIGDPEDQGIRACMPLYPMRHLNSECIIVDDFGDYAFNKALSWNICYGRIEGKSRTYSDYYSSSTYNADKDTRALLGNCIVLFSDGYIHPIQLILHEDHRGVEVLLNQLPWGPTPLMSLDEGAAGDRYPRGPGHGTQLRTHFLRIDPPPHRHVGPNLFLRNFETY